jgi:DNA-binding beta-propeller fold protein YncE
VPQTISVGTAPAGVAVNPSANAVYVANGIDDTCR